MKPKTKYLILQSLMSMMMFQTLVWFTILMTWWGGGYEMQVTHPLVMFAYVSLINTLSGLFLFLGVSQRSKQYLIVFWILDLMFLMASLLVFFVIVSQIMGFHAYSDLTVDLLVPITLSAQAVVASLLLVLTFEDSMASIHLTPHPLPPPPPHTQQVQPDKHKVK